MATRAQEAVTAKMPKLSEVTYGRTAKMPPCKGWQYYGSRFTANAAQRVTRAQHGAVRTGMTERIANRFLVHCHTAGKARAHLVPMKNLKTI